MTAQRQGVIRAVTGFLACAAVAGLAGVSLAWSAPRDEPSTGYRAYLDPGAGLESIVVMPTDGAADQYVTASSAVSGFLGGLTGIPDQFLAAEVASAANELGALEDQEVLRSMSAKVDADGQVVTTFSAYLLASTGLLKVAETSSNGFALAYSPPIVDLPAEPVVGSTWSGAGSVNGIAEYESESRVEASDDEGCIDIVTALSIRLEGSDLFASNTRSTWCLGRGSTRSTDTDSGQVVLVVDPPGALPLADALPPGMPGYPAPAPLPFLSPSVLQPAVVAGDLLAMVNASSEDVLAIPMQPPAAVPGDDPPETLAVAWMQHPDGDILGATGDGQDLYLTTTRRAVISIDRAGRLRWTARTPDVAAGAPAIVGDSIVVATLDGSVHAYDAKTGAPRWTRTMGDAVVAAPVSSGGHVVVADIAGQVRSLTASGDVAWSVETAAVTDPLTALADGSVLVGDADGYGHVIAPTGVIEWTAVLAGSLRGPAQQAGDVVVLPTTAGLQGLARSSGDERWRDEAWDAASVWGDVSGRPSVLATMGGRLARVGADGSIAPLATDLLEPSADAVTELQVIGIDGTFLLLTDRGTLLPWPEDS
ncbi:MAG: PQQ-binding-like beta-propeller repeat protein [Actinomycetota bacterium]|nr:PQQ-binding-like beta-propeller repeat protein [Actinomycetota bacterium]